MDEDRLREWVRKKLDSGVKPERVKKSLEETGHDPSVVDKVQDPFSGTEESSDESSESATQENDSIDEEEKELDEDLDLAESGSEESDDGMESFDSGSLDGSGRSLPHISISPDPSKKTVLGLGVLVLLLLLVVGIGVFAPGLGGSISSGVSNVGSIAHNTDSGSTSTVEVDKGVTGKCPDGSGVVIKSVRSSGGSTTATIFVTSGTVNVVLNVYQDDNLIGSTSKEISGTSTITASKTGNKVVAHPYGCQKIIDSEAY
ncbi:MAG: hypothetical protein ABEJ99_00370 [Candidatus Nanohaloarchaea archaeon]